LGNGEKYGAQKQDGDKRDQSGDPVQPGRSLGDRSERFAFHGKSSLCSKIRKNKSY
jgi:hypothetical protein